MATSAIAQINTLTITSPASIAGTYSVSVASYGDLSGNEVSGELVLANDGDTTDSNGDGTPGTETDGCESFANDVTGKIAVVDRGECFFGTKSENAQAAGAIAVLVCNNNSTDGDVINVMGAGSNGEGSGTTILSVSTSYNICQTLKMALGSETVNGSLSFTCRTPNYGPNVIWGDMPGEGDFENGLNGWTIENEDAEGDGWEWVSGNSGFSIFNATIGSNTECNGYMHIDSWNNRFDGGTGDCEPCNGGIVSPIIDLTGQSIDGLYVEFDQMFIQFFQRVYVLASNDGGVTYKDTLEVNQTTPVNAFEGLRTLRVPLPGYENEDNIRLKFYKNEFNNFGGFYYWGIDDVRLINESSLDMQVNTNFFAVNPSYRTPLSQVSEIPFLVDIFNNGNVTGENVMVDVEITGPQGNVVFNTTQNYPDVPSWTSYENQVFDETFTPSDMGFYTGVYRMNTAGDANANNNEIPFFFEVTQDIMSPLPPESDFTGEAFQGITDGSTWAEGASAFTLNYAAAHTFYIPNGDGMTISNVRFGVLDKPLNNGIVNAWLYAWLRQDDDSSGNFTISSDQTLLVGTRVGGGQIINPAFGSQRIIDIELGQADLQTGEAMEDANGNPIPIELRDDQLYVLVLATNSNNQTQIELLGFDADNANIQNRNFLVNAANLALDSLGSKRVTGTSMQQTASGDFNEIDALDITGGTWGINELYVEYTITQRVGTEDLNEALDISVYPNPTTELLVVDLDLVNVSPVVNIELVNMEGKQVIVDNFTNVSKQKITFDVSGLTAGMYNVNIRTEDGFISKPVIILD
jgi:hypothetical protein